MRFSLTILLIAANAVAFVWQSTTGGGVDSDHGWLTPQAVFEHGQWWRIFSAAFLHANIAHIGLNMLALYSLGNEVEAIYGKARFALLYVFAIVGSGLAIVYFSPYAQPTLGASGAIYGLFGAIVAVGLRLGKRGRSVIMSVVPILVLNLVFTFSIPGISWQAHVGGLITGIVAGYALFMGSRRRRLVAAYAYAAAPEAADHVETIEHSPEPGPRE